ncbi:DUF6572 domain-containing protein [Blastococcus xanthinilyticus]|uniref:Uncharacterized protein n=1 Tax=Blastococcus xanthinilyticus TaxID=1564164 RepID=A0A5S5CV46_9ACTN|nr:DUF6572 domain-containing protein [Blastococcus xanthinilyticus]TYP86858.1 hypothetical protein BD833_108143 [Blastococcus xanthinilyticus]
MSVREAHTVDQIARSPEGLLVLIATEDRPYTPEAAPALAEELRVKLNTYIYGVKSGQIHERRPGEPMSVVLYTASHPPAEVLQILEVAGQVLAEDGVGVDWRLLEMPERTYVDVLQEMAASLRQAAPADWTSLTYYATVIGPKRRDSFDVTTPSGNVRLPGGPEDVRNALDELKRLMWTPEKGAWIGVQLVLDRESGQLEPGFNYSIEPVGEPLAAEVLTEELRHFPRPPGALPDWWAERIGEQG